MTQDARTEAERAVKDLLHADRRTDTDDGVYEQSRLLVDALAAAIAVRDEHAAHPHSPCDCAACDDLDTALSALRGVG